MATFRIHLANLADMHAAVAELNKKGSKLGGAVTIQELSRDEDYATVELTGNVPRVSGWDFLAKITHVEPGKNLVLSMVDGGVPEYYRTCAPDCEHCNVQRQRNDTLVLRNVDNGSLIQVGRTCLKDFVRSEDVEQALKLWKFFEKVQAAIDDFSDTDDDSMGSGGGRSAQYAVDRDWFMTKVVAAVRQFGWVSGAMARDSLDPNMCSTATLVLSDGRKIESTEEDYAKAQTIINWVRDEFNGANDYVWNLKVSLSQDAITLKMTGFAASAVSAYDREQTKRVKQSLPDASTHVGSAGQRLKLEGLTVTSVRVTEGYYGTTTILNMTDKAGNVFVWFASGKLEDFQAGDVVSGVATVKKHDSFNGTKQTVVTRAKLKLDK